MKYLGRNTDLEVQALYALQNIVHNLEHPPSKSFDHFVASIIDEWCMRLRECSLQSIIHLFSMNVCLKKTEVKSF